MGLTGLRMGSEEGSTNEELHILCQSSTMARMIKPGRFSWRSNVAEMEDGRIAFKVLTVKSTWCAT